MTRDTVCREVDILLSSMVRSLLEYGVGCGSIIVEVRGGALMALLLGPGDRVPRDATDNGSPTVGLPYMSKLGKRKVSSPAAWQGEAGNHGHTTSQFRDDGPARLGGKGCPSTSN